MDPVIWAALLMLLGICLVVLEVFLPSGGILGFLAFAAVLAAVILAFYFSGSTTGILFGGFAVLALPLTIAFSLKLLPETAMGRKLLLIEDEGAAEESKSEEARLAALVGAVGVAKSLMLPGGTVRIERRNYDAVSEGSVPIEPNQVVEVVQVRHERLVVRPTDRLPPSKANQPSEQDILNKPLDSLGLDDLEDPLS